MTKKIRYFFPYKTIIYDEDGAFTGQDAGSWAISNTWSHNLWDGECWEEEIYDGLLCSNQITVRTVWIHNVSPTSLYNYEICVLKYDESIIGEFNTTEELQTYEAAGEENEECSIIEFRGK